MRIRLVAVGLGVLALGSSSAQQSELRGDDEQPRLIEQAIRDFDGKRFDAALQRLKEAHQRAPASAATLNLLGAVYTKKEDFQTAKAFFERSLTQDPRYFPAAFNLGELLFLQRNYPQALDVFSRMLSADPGNELLQFKTVVCLLLVRQPDEAKKLLARMNFPGNGPAWHFAHAASLMTDGNQPKARALLATAQVIFPGKTSLYEETFQGLGWPAR